MNEQLVARGDLGQLSDQPLIDLVRLGVRDAEGVLYARYFGESVRVAHGIIKNFHAAEDVAAVCFEKIFMRMRSGQGPDRTFRGYLYTTVSRAAAVFSARQKDFLPVAVVSAPVTREYDHTVERVLGNFDAELIVAAFRSLPTRWQIVLKLAEVEEQKPSVVAGQIGLSPNAASVLLQRAKAGLRAAFVQTHIPDSSYPTCSFVLQNYGFYVTGKMAPRDRTRIEGHLALCLECAAVHEENRRLVV